jgi:hypothetical protein
MVLIGTITIPVGTLITTETITATIETITTIETIIITEALTVTENITAIGILTVITGTTTIIETITTITETTTITEETTTIGAITEQTTHGEVMDVPSPLTTSKERMTKKRKEVGGFGMTGKRITPSQIKHKINVCLEMLKKKQGDRTRMLIIDLYVYMDG